MLPAAGDRRPIEEHIHSPVLSFEIGDAHADIAAFEVSVVAVPVYLEAKILHILPDGNEVIADIDGILTIRLNDMAFKLYRIAVGIPFCV